MLQITIGQALQIAIGHHASRRLQDAETICRQILAADPKHAEALHLFGLIASETGRLDVAAELIQRAIVAKPADPIFHYNLGNVFFAQHLLDQSIACYRRAIVLKPELVEAHNNLSVVLAETGQLDEAIACCQRALTLKPDHVEAHLNLSKAYQAQGENGRAIDSYRRALTLRPDDAAIHNNLGIVLCAVNRLDEGAASFRRALELRPSDAHIFQNLGNALRDTGQLDDAITAYRHAIKVDPSNPAICSNLLYGLHFHPAYGSQDIAHEHRRWNDQHAEPLRKFIQPFTNDRDPDRRLRVGYVSPDFRNHVVGRNLLPLFMRRDRGQFEVICYANVERPDAVTVQFQRHADGWCNIVSLSDEQVAEQIRRDRIDILVDLTLHMSRNRILIFARKPAPVQLTFAGYPGSTGLSTIDYRLSDPYLDPPGMDETIYSERAVRLADSFWCYDPLDCADIPVNDLPALSFSKESDGPARQSGVVTFGCLNNFAKINPGVLQLWAQVLRGVVDSRLLLLAPVGAARQKTVQMLGGEGIEAKRIEFVPPQARREYLKYYHRIDIGLDSFPYNGHTTSLDSYWMGVPVVTLEGSTVAGRAGVSQLTNLGLPELIAHKNEEFVRIATELAGDLPRLAGLRGTLRKRMEDSSLMDATRFARNIETAYRWMWRSWCEK